MCFSLTQRCLWCRHYFLNCTEAAPLAVAQSDAVAEELWQASERMVGITSEEREAAAAVLGKASGGGAAERVDKKTQ